MTKITLVLTFIFLHSPLASAHIGHGSSQFHSHGEVATAVIAALTILFGLFHFYKKS